MIQCQNSFEKTCIALLYSRTQPAEVQFGIEHTS